MHFYTQEYGSYPFQDYKLAFVEDAWADTASSASLTICSSRLLHTDDITDQIYSTRRELSQALARQWFGIYIVQKSWPDTWLVRGIANLMGSLFIKRHLGNNEYRLRMKKVSRKREKLSNDRITNPFNYRTWNFAANWM
jgi:transcription initiation factor TFIID subunit 2